MFYKPTAYVPTAIRPNAAIDSPLKNQPKMHELSEPYRSVSTLSPEHTQSYDTLPQHVSKSQMGVSYANLRPR